MALTPLQKLGLDFHEWGVFQDEAQSPEGRGFELKLHDEERKKFGEIRSPLSPFYFTFRTQANKGGPLTLERLVKIGAFLYAMAKDANLWYNCICGIPKAGDPFANAFALAAVVDGWSIPIITLQKNEGKKGRRIVGPPQGDWVRDRRVLLLDDLVTKEDTKLEGVEAIRKSGLIVSDLLVVLDRRKKDQPSKLVAAGVTLHSVFTLSSLLDLYYQKKKISRDVYQKCLNYKPGARKTSS